MDKSHQQRLICLILIAATIAVYAGVLGSAFTNLDDNVYVTDNPQVQAGLTPASMAWAFTATYRCTYQPMVWLSFMLDRQIGGPGPSLFHLTNLLLHIACTLLLFLILTRLTGSSWRSGFVALLFAIHPLHVESVAWVAERKDVLSTLFWFLTILAYLRYVERRDVKSYLLVVAGTALGLMSKPMLVTLPITLLLLDHWPLGRTADTPLKRLVLEKAPLFALAAASCVVTYIVQQSGGAMGSTQMYPIGVRAANAIISYVAYIRMMVWPAGLAVFYPHPGKTLALSSAIIPAVLLVAASILAIKAGKRRPYIAVGWFWYVITLIPVIGLVQISAHSMADRFTYVPLIGLFVIAGWGIPELLAVVKSAQVRCGILVGSAAAASIALAICAHTQVGYWTDSEILFQHTVAVTRPNALAQNNWGEALASRGRSNEAASHYLTALQIDPCRVDARCNLAKVLVSQGQLKQAIAQLKFVLRLSPHEPDAHNNLGVAYAIQGNMREAAKHFAAAVEADPNKISARQNLARATAMLDQAGG